MKNDKTRYSHEFSENLSSKCLLSWFFSSHNFCCCGNLILQNRVKKNIAGYYNIHAHSMRNLPWIRGGSLDWWIWNIIRAKYSSREFQVEFDVDFEEKLNWWQLFETLHNFLQNILKREIHFSVPDLPKSFKEKPFFFQVKWKENYVRIKNQMIFVKKEPNKHVPCLFPN